MAAKVIGPQSVIGQLGVNLIERRVLEMGWLWHPTGVLDAGIDGVIELRDPSTGEALNSIGLKSLQSATAGLEAAIDSQLRAIRDEVTPLSSPIHDLALALMREFEKTDRPEAPPQSG